MSIFEGWVIKDDLKFLSFFELVSIALSFFRCVCLLCLQVLGLLGLKFHFLFSFMVVSSAVGNFSIELSLICCCGVFPEVVGMLLFD